MAKIESIITQSGENDEVLFTFLSNFNNFEHLLPAGKIKDWKSDGDSCSFSLDGIGKASLNIIEKEPNKLIKIGSGPGTPINFLLWIQLKRVAENDTRIKVTIDPEINLMVMSMVKGPLQEFVDMLANQIGELQLG